MDAINIKRRDPFTPRDCKDRVNAFTYSRSALVDGGDQDAEVTHRVQSWWNNWKEHSVIETNEKASGYVYRTALLVIIIVIEFSMVVTQLPSCYI